MGQAVVNPEDLRQFAQTLKRFNSTLEQQLSSLGGQLETLSQSWRDQENRKFAEEFSEHLKHISRFIEANNQHIPYLMRKADRIDEYLQQR